MKEIWKSVAGFENIYEVSDLGRIKSLNRTDALGRLIKGKIKTAFDNGNGYLIVALKVNGKQTNKSVHRLVAAAFIPNPDNLPEVNHKDGNKRNNSVSNLEWCTKSENMKHASENGLCKTLKGEENPNHKLSRADVEYIRQYARPYHPIYGYVALAKKFGVSSTVIKYVHWGRSYKEC